jgi:hypothetical protein
LKGWTNKRSGIAWLCAALHLGCALILLFPSSEAKADDFALPEGIVLDVLAQRLSTPEKLESFMKKHFRFMSDRAQFGIEEYWQTPKELLTHSAGDCEDFALFAQAILSRNGYRVFLLSVFWREDAHTVAVFEKEGVTGYFDIDKLRLTSTSSLSELGNSIQKGWSYLGLMRTEGNLGIISRKFMNENAKVGLSLLFPAAPRPTAAALSEVQA